jgi:hypothetical protein
MVLQAAFQPLLRRFVQQDAAAIGAHGGDFGKTLAHQLVQRLHTAEMGVEVVGKDQPVVSS